jgi:hypothetical protein
MSQGFHRQFGTGALQDFAVAAARRQKATRWRGADGPAPRRLPAEVADDRWYGEGGNTQTRIARRARRAFA